MNRGSGFRKALGSTNTGSVVSRNTDAVYAPHLSLAQESFEVQCKQLCPQPPLQLWRDTYVANPAAMPVQMEGGQEKCFPGDLTCLNTTTPGSTLAPKPKKENKGKKPKGMDDMGGYQAGEGNNTKIKYLANDTSGTSTGTEKDPAEEQQWAEYLSVLHGSEIQAKVVATLIEQGCTESMAPAHFVDAMINEVFSMQQETEAHYLGEKAQGFLVNRAAHMTAKLDAKAKYLQGISSGNTVPDQNTDMSSITGIRDFMADWMAAKGVTWTNN